MIGPEFWAQFKISLGLQGLAGLSVAGLLSPCNGNWSLWVPTEDLQGAVFPNATASLAASVPALPIYPPSHIFIISSTISHIQFIPCCCSYFGGTQCHSSSHVDIKPEKFSFPSPSFTHLYSCLKFFFPAFPLFWLLPATLLSVLFFLFTSFPGHSWAASAHFITQHMNIEELLF